MNETAVETSNPVKFYWQLCISENETAFERNILDVITQMGFSDFCYGLVDAQFGLKGNMACSWKHLCEAYKKDAFYHYEDMIYNHCLHCENPLYLSTVDAYIASATFETELFTRTREVIDCYKAHGYSDAYFIPFKTKNGSGNALFSVMSKSNTPTEFKRLIKQEKPVLLLFAEAIDFVSTTKFSNHYGKIASAENSALKQKPLRLLQTMASGNMTLKEAADKLCISLDTANKHIALAKKALNAKTQAAAVYNALKLGLMSCDPDCDVQ